MTCPEVVNWRASFIWLAVGVVCFNFAYEWVTRPSLGLCIIGHDLALVRLTDQPTVRRAFYFGLATAYLRGCCG